MLNLEIIFYYTLCSRGYYIYSLVIKPRIIPLKLVFIEDNKILNKILKNTKLILELTYLLS